MNEDEDVLDEREAEYVDRLINDWEPDDPEEVAAREKAEYRKTEKAALIRDLKRQGRNNAWIKLYAPGIMKRREQDGIDKIEKSRNPRRRVLGRPIGKRGPRRTGASRR